MVVGSLPIAVMDPPSELIRIDCQGNLPSDRDELRCYSTRDTGRTVQNSGCGADFADTHSTQYSAIELIQEVLSCTPGVGVYDDVGYGFVPGTSFKKLLRR